jgi:hypothetical protein
MQIHLARPGGQKEGPFTLEQINQGISVGILQDTDYWAWYVGLPEWIPLHRLLRSFAAATSAAPSEATPEPKPAVFSSERQVSSVKVADAVASTGQTSHLAHQVNSVQVSGPDVFVAAGAAASEPAGEAVNATLSRPTPVIAESAVFAASNPNPDPKARVVAESDVVTALVQAVAEPEPKAKPVGLAAALQPSPQNEMAQPQHAANPARADAPSSVARLAEPAKAFDANSAGNQRSSPITQHAPVRHSFSEGASHITEVDAPPTAKQSASGLPFGALERMFVFSTGGRQSIWDSPTASRMLQDIIGEDPGAIRLNVPRDVVFNCNLGGLLGREGDLSDSVWQAMAARQPELVQRQRQGAHQVCFRMIRIESGVVIVLVLFYDSAKAASAAA